MALHDREPVSDTEAAAFFSDLAHAPALVLAVSGGPDSTALMLLAARWRAALNQGPKLVAITVDHGLRKEAKQEAVAVAKLARKLKIAHRTLRWTGKKPNAGLQQAARLARYRLLADAARKVKATQILTAHTLDDQAETVLIRMSRGSGITGLGAMTRTSAVPGDVAGTLALLRPLLDIPKSRLIATLQTAKIAFAEDPSNHDPRFTRARLRGLTPQLAAEGLNAARFATLARRLRRADEALEAAVDGAVLAATPSGLEGVWAYDASTFFALPSEIGLRLLGRAISALGDEGPVELGKLEALKEALDTAQRQGARFRRTLAGGIVTLTKAALRVERAPPRRKALTKRRPGRGSRLKSR